MNAAAAIKAEILRISRAEIRRETAVLRKSTAAQRREIASLKRHAQELERKLKQFGRVRQTAEPVAEQAAVKNRFSAKSIVSQRKRLGLTVADLGRLLGTSAQTVYNWEEGKIRPRKKHLPAIFALRTLGRRQAQEIAQSRR